MFRVSLRAAAAGAALSIWFQLPSDALASNLLPPGVDSSDLPLQGSRVADPPTPAAALFANPAGLTQFDSTTIGTSIGVGYGASDLDASSTIGYRDSEEQFPLIPAFGLAMPLSDRLYFGTGLFGSTGSTFEFEADPGLGIDEFFSETIVLELPFALAYRVSDSLSVGAKISGLFGQLRTHYTLMGTYFNYKINSPGVQAGFGATWKASDDLSFGLGLQTPGVVWMDGTMDLGGGMIQDVEVDLQIPAKVFLGATYRCSPRLTLSSSIRFIDSSSFGESIIKFELTPAANVPFIPDAKDEWKYSIGAEYQFRDDWWLRLGASYASHIVGSAGVNPLVYDADDTKISAGLAHAFGEWKVDAMVGYAFPDSRSISPAGALVLPGEYSMRGGIVAFGFTRTFAAE